MAAITAASTRRESAGSLTLMLFTFTSITDADTFASGLGGNVAAFWAQTTGDPATQGSAGFNVTNSSGTFTLYPGENAFSGTLFVLATV